MNTKTYTQLLAQPSSIDKEQLGDLAMIIDKYPYFQSARALQLKGLKNEHSFLYNDALKLTAAYTTDRNILFEYITSETFVQNQISELILQQSEAVKDMEVVSENLSEQISLEIDQQLKTEMKKAEAILNPDLFARKIESVVQLSNEGKDPSEEKLKEEPKATTPESSPTTEVNSDEPLPFTKNDTHTFGEWLKLTKASPIVRDETPSEKDKTPANNDSEEKLRKFELIEKFIQDRPKLSPTDSNTKNKNLAKPYIQSPDTHMTETLAKVYLQQKNYKKAIQAYKILILKNPEKSGFFADQIRAIQKLIKEQK